MTEHTEHKDIVPTPPATRKGSCCKKSREKSSTSEEVKRSAHKGTTLKNKKKSEQKNSVLKEEIKSEKKGITENMKKETEQEKLAPIDETYEEHNRTTSSVDENAVPVPKEKPLSAEILVSIPNNVGSKKFVTAVGLIDT